MEDKNVMCDLHKKKKKIFLKHPMNNCLTQKVWICLWPHQISGCASHTGADEIFESETSRNCADKTEASCSKMHNEPFKDSCFLVCHIMSCIAIIFERPLIRRVAANKLNKQSRTVDEGWSFSLGVGRGANNSSL